MSSFISMLNSQLVLFVYIFAGVYAKKKGIITDSVKQKLTSLVLKISLPCMIFNSFNRVLTPEILKKTAMAFVVAACIALLSFVLGKFIYNMFPEEKRKILEYTTLVNNSGFLGMPLVQGVFGDEGLLYASIFIIPNRIMMWTAGLSIFTQSDFKTKMKNILLNPCIITVYLGLARRILNIPFPAFLDTAIGKIGGITSPLSMMIIGSMMVGVSWKTMLEPAIFYLAAVRLIFLPLVALGVMKLMHFDPLLSGVSLILTGMPAGSTAALLATQYGADEGFASRCIISTTLMSLFTAPLLMLLA